MMKKTSKMYAGGGKMPMKKDSKTGEMRPAFLVDQNGMKMGGVTVPKTKGYFKGGKTKGYTKGGKTLLGPRRGSSGRAPSSSTLGPPKSGEELLSRGTPSGLGPPNVDVGRGRGRRGGREIK